MELYTFTLWGIFLIYRTQFPNLRSYFRNKICFSLLRIILLRDKICFSLLRVIILRDKICFSLLRIILFRNKICFSLLRIILLNKGLEIMKFKDKYLLCVFFHNKFPICGEMAGWEDSGSHTASKTVPYDGFPCGFNTMGRFGLLHETGQAMGQHGHRVY